MFYRRSHASAGLVLLTAVGVLSGCHRAQTASAPPPPPEVSVATVQRASVPITVGLPGRTNALLRGTGSRACRRHRIEAQLQGRLRCKSGTTALQHRSGALSGRARQREGSLQKSQSALPALVATAKRFKALVGNGVSRRITTTPSRRATRRPRMWRRARQQSRPRKINLGYTTVTSPITGRIGISQVTEGAYVQASAATLMTTIQQIDPIYVDLTQSSVEGLQLRRDIASGQAENRGPESGEGHADAGRRHAISDRGLVTVHRHHRRPEHGFGDRARDVPESAIACCCPACSCARVSKKAWTTTRSSCRRSA